MLLRYVVLHGCPRTDEEWNLFEKWRERQLAAPECKMCQAEVSPADWTCSDCPGKPGCPKERRRHAAE